MSSEQLPEVSDATNTRAGVREKALQVQAKQARARTIRVSVISVVVVLVCAAVSFGVYRAIDDVADLPAHYPTGLEADGMRVLSVTGLDSDVIVELPPTDPDPTALGEGEGEGEDEPDTETEVEPTDEETEPEVTMDVVDIHIYVDFLSPSSGAFQRANARQLTGWIIDGAVTVTYYPVALLTASSNGTRYSLRAAAAAACVASHSPERFYAFTHDLLVNQPEVNSDGLSDEELAVMAVAAGGDDPKAIRSCIEEQHFLVWAKEATARALAGPLPGTESLALSAPSMVVINGQAYTGALDNPAEFVQFVQSVASNAYYEKASQANGGTPSSDD